MLSLPRVKKTLAIGLVPWYNSLVDKRKRLLSIVLVGSAPKEKPGAAGLFASLKYALHARKRAATHSNHGSPSDYTCKTFRLQKYIACSRLQDIEKPQGVCPGACVLEIVGNFPCV